IAERAFGELLDVALVHERYRLATAPLRVLDRGTDQPLRTRNRDRLDADTRIGPDLPTELLLQHRDGLLRFGRAFLGPQAGVDAFGVLAEDHHVDEFGMFDG